jgi:acetyl esterase/lipase
MNTVALVIAEGVDLDPGWLSAIAEMSAAELGARIVHEEVVSASASVIVVDSSVPGPPPPELPASSGPRIWVDIAVAQLPLRVSIPEDEPLIRGRGVEGVQWGVAQAVRRIGSPPDRIAYGPGRDRYADVRLLGGEPPFPVAVLLHGGFWRERWTLDTIEPLAVDLVERGIATWNVEYRRVGPSGGGWPGTQDDVDSALRALAGQSELFDPGRVVIVGHSAGAQLAVVAAARAAEEQRAPRLVVSLAGVLDMRLCAVRGLGDTGNAAAAYMGAAPAEADGAYALASPIELLSLGIPQLVVQGVDDSPDLVEFGRRYASAALRLGDDVEQLELPGDHFGVITPSSEIWEATAARIVAAVAQ